MVEWGHSCYQSDWHLFRDATEQVTSGRYYFAEAGTPHVPALHHYGSRRWHDANWGIDLELGEDVISQHVWDAGDSPVRMPRNAIEGTAACLSSGELFEDSISSEDVEGGFVDACYLPLPTLDPRWYVVSDYKNCKMQKFYAALILLSYLNNGTEILARIVALLGADLTVTWHPASGLMPAVTTIIHPTWSVAIMDGTRDYEQIAVQALTSIRSPQSFGAFGTLPLWYQASQYVRKMLGNDGVTAGAPMMLVGHSYGGAAGLVLAARLRRASDERVLRYLTFGVPKTGDSKIRALIAKCDGMNLANDGDLITIFPPDAITLFPVMTALGVPGLTVWTDWLPAPNQVRQDQDGKLFPNDLGQCDFATLFLWASNAIAVIDEPFVFEHSITEYLARILKRCPGVPPDQPIVTPGLTCATALELTANLEFEFDIPIGVEHWFRYDFAALSIAGYAVRVTAGDIATAFIYAERTCLASSPTRTDTGMSFCFTADTWVNHVMGGPATRFFVRIAGGTVPVTYRIRMLDSVCD